VDRETRTAISRRLRRDQTSAEAQLWKALRGGRADGLKVRRQHPVGPYVADFAIESPRLVIELDGGVHDDEAQALKDFHRQQALERLGWTVLRFPNGDVTARLPEVLEAIRRHASLVRP
jgi:very-short-patch-repair endonuclease